MSNPYKVLVIVPAYNEAESICATVKAVIDSGYDYVVVNDGSTDNTLEICHANHLNVLDLPQNLGIGGLYKPAISTLKNMDITSTFRWMAMDNMIHVLFPVWLSRLKLATTWLSGLGFSSELGVSVYVFTPSGYFMAY